ncbi:MAG: lipoprotein [Hydrogenovibrio sp.]|nr:lipoprotein [Hydrogenovibrio sp.]
MIFHKHRITVFAIGLIGAMIALNGCGRKGALYIPTDAQRAEMQKEQAERDAILKAREARKKDAEKSSEDSTSEPASTQP